MASDPFLHLPELRNRLVPADGSAVRVTAEVMAQWDARALAHGLGAGWRQSDSQLEAGRRALLGHRLADTGLWFFGYGSLMWDPAVHFVEVRRADLPGHGRRFCYRTIMGRGTPERPALTLSLLPADESCHGLVFRLAAPQAESESALLWRREMLRGGYRPALLPVHTPQGPVTALVFAANPGHEGHAADLALDETARIIASANGPMGSNRDYLLQLAAQLDALGIADDYIHQLRDRVLACR